MAIFLNTTNAQALFDDFSGKCKSRTIHTWRVDATPALIHTGSDIGEKGFFLKTIEPNRLVLNFHFFPGNMNRREVYGVLHGRLIEMFMAHCYGGFTSGVFSASPTGLDATI